MVRSLQSPYFSVAPDSVLKSVVTTVPPGHVDPV